MHSMLENACSAWLRGCVLILLRIISSPPPLEADSPLNGNDTMHHQEPQPGNKGPFCRGSSSKWRSLRTRNIYIGFRQRRRRYIAQCKVASFELIVAEGRLSASNRAWCLENNAVHLFSCRSCWRNLAMWVDKCIRRDETIPNFNRYLMRMDTTWRRSIYCRNWLRAAYDHWSWYSHHIRLVLLLYSVPDHRDVISRVFIL